MLDPENYTVACQLFIRLLGLIYFFAFFPFLFQIRGLIGKNGILPVKAFLNRIHLALGRRSYYRLPTLFWFNCSDRALMAVVITGTLLSIALLFGIYPALLLPLLMILYISIISVGQDFLSFGWEMFLMEITANAILLSWTTTPNLFAWLSVNFLVARFHLQSGAVKLQSGDRNWHKLTALHYHYQTQPIPNTTAWFFHHTPSWFKKFSCGMMFFIELVMPIFVFANAELRLITFLSFAGLQYFIWLTGNFSYLNSMSVALSVVLISNGYFGAPASAASAFGLADALASIGGVTLLSLQLMRLWTHFFPNPLFSHILSWVSPFHIANRYGIFAIMTTKRYEIVVEGSDDGVVWKEYLFKHKPSEVSRRPRRISPYQPRIDWQAWFLPFSSYQAEPWFQSFLKHLLKGTPEVLKLLRSNPFPERPPKYIRAIAYDYVYSDWGDKDWWKRTYMGSYSPVLSNTNSGKQQALEAHIIEPPKPGGLT